MENKGESFYYVGGPEISHDDKHLYALNRKAYVQSHLQSNSLLYWYKRDKLSIELSELTGNNLLDFSLDLVGSRFICMKLGTASEDVREAACEEIARKAPELATNAYGHFVLMKVLELGTAIRLEEIAVKLCKDVVNLVYESYGSRVIQKAIERLKLEQKMLLVRALDEHVLTCLFHEYGSKVIGHAIR